MSYIQSLKCTLNVIPQKKNNHIINNIKIFDEHPTNFWNMSKVQKLDHSYKKYIKLKFFVQFWSVLLRLRIWYLFDELESYHYKAHIEIQFLNLIIYSSEIPFEFFFLCHTLTFYYASSVVLDKGFVILLLS